MLNGFLLIDKDVNTTSNDVVKMVKKRFNINKAGHSGTLDPDVTGLVVVALNSATKLLPFITKDSKKEYECILKLGINTDTLDLTGTILEEKVVRQYEEKEILEVLNSFIKTYEQYPPKYSSKQVKGKRLYEYARNNEEVEIKPSTVTIHDINFIKYENDEITFTTIVSKGTYIRSLCYDIAEQLNTIGCMKYLRRTKTDGFDVSDALNIKDVNENNLIDLDLLIKSKYASYQVYGPILDMVSNGAVLNQKDDYKYPCAYVNEETKRVVAVYDIHPTKEGKTKPILMI